MTDGLRLEVRARRDLDSDTFERVTALCTRAYEEPFAGILDQFREATHLLGWMGETLVSHALWVARPLTAGSRLLRSAYVEAVATEPAHQGRGHASALLRALGDQIASFDLGALSPSEAAFYARLGWESWRGPLAVATPYGLQPTPEEEVMILRLPKTPPLDLDGPLVAPWREGDVW